jgi:hypothetical protein
MPMQREFPSGSDHCCAATRNLEDTWLEGRSRRTQSGQPDSVSSRFLVAAQQWSLPEGNTYAEDNLPPTLGDGTPNVGGRLSSA